MTVLIRPPMPASLGDRLGVDDVELELLVDDLPLDLDRELLPDLVRAVGAVEQEGRPGLGELEHVDPLEEAELVAGHEVGVVDQVGRVDRPRAEAEVRDGDRARLLGVVDEVALGVERRCSRR